MDKKISDIDLEEFPVPTITIKEEYWWDAEEMCKLLGIDWIKETIAMIEPKYFCYASYKYRKGRRKFVNKAGVVRLLLHCDNGIGRYYHARVCNIIKEDLEKENPPRVHLNP